MATVTVCSKLPFDFIAELGEKKVTFKGARGIDPVSGEGFLTSGYGMTTGVDGDWFDAWKAAHPDFPAIQNGVIFAAAPNKADGEAKELAPEVKSGLEQKSEDELGVKVVPKDE